MTLSLNHAISALMMRIIYLITIIFAYLLLPIEAQAAIVTTPAVLSAAQKDTLSRVEQYLTSVHSIRAEFTQAAPDGDISTGTFYLLRPGKLRMEYAPPTPVLMITKGGEMVYYDKELDQVSHVSLDSSLVGFLSRESVKFDNTVIITAMESNASSIRITLIQAAHPKDGSLTLELADNPLILHNMIVSDASGQITTVALNNARYNQELPEDLFVFHDPHLGNSSPIKK